MMDFRNKTILGKLYEFIHCNLFGHRCSKCGGELKLIGFDESGKWFVYECKECGYLSF